jgi:calcineurin-like phosphoesterase
VGGLDTEVEVRKFITQIPEYSKTKCENLELQGVVVEIDDQGHAVSIQRIKKECKDSFDGDTG